MKNYLLAFLFVGLLFAFKSDKPAYALFDAKGRQVHYADLLEKASEAEVILFGEQHDNPIDHWLEQELTKDLHAARKGQLVLGAEMFEADDQIVVDEYLSGSLSEKGLKDECKLWTNFPTDYKPLLDFAKKNGLRFVATNIPRRYANMVYGKGLEKLDSVAPDAKKWIAPLPIAYDKSLKCYADIFNAAKGHGGENLPKSQAIKDATMAWFILQHLEQGKSFLHFNGSYHSDLHQGIVWYLKQAKPDLKILTISSVEQEGLEEVAADNAGLGDFVLVTPTSLSKSYRP
ncbi:MAG: ChaN family lipoprotein [Marinilabiliales bacterium]|nr:ChaN family lipoprotein [Marinilabiliales bacterium]